MNDARQGLALRWLYNHCGNKWITPAVLDKTQNPDPSLVEIFDITEIYSIFEHLRKEGYILPVINQFGARCFVLNEMKEGEWIERLKDLSPTPERVAGKWLKFQSNMGAANLWSSFSGGLAAFVLLEIAKYFFGK